MSDLADCYAAAADRFILSDGLDPRNRLVGDSERATSL